MKKNKIYLFIASAAMLTLSACNDLNEQEFEGYKFLSADQRLATNEAIPERVKATYDGMFNYLGKGGTSGLSKGQRADDFGIVMALIAGDIEGADASCADNNYNWFSVCDELSSRNASYANPYIRYSTPYKQMGVANSVINSYPADTEDETAVNFIASAKTIRAFDYMMLAPYFQFGYATAADQPCVPLLSDSVDATHNPRATVEEVYNVILNDLNYAVQHLDTVRSNKQYINVDVATGLRARAYLAMGKWAEAAADAETVINSGRYEPATIDEVSVPGFDDATSGDGHGWIWAVLRTEADAQENSGYGNYQTSGAWNCAFSGDGYAPATGNTPVINQLLYDKIPSTDVRKGWWLNADKHSPNWANITWRDDEGNSATGDEIADFIIQNVKVALLPYTNIKFGMKNGVGNTTNMNDFPLIRIEEMYLIAAEGYAKSDNEAKAREILTNFVKEYRDPGYDINGRNLTLADEIWFQRRVELWGEGFFTFDAKRLGKPIVRFHSGKDNNFPNAYQFNVAADDGWLNMRFPQSELDNNLSIVNNTGGSLPVAGQNGNLRDGVTD